MELKCFGSLYFFYYYFFSLPKAGQIRCHIWHIYIYIYRYWYTRIINVPGEKCIMHMQRRKTRFQLAVEVKICACRTAMAFGVFGFLNGNALQRETEKGTRWIYYILYYTTRKSFQSGSCFFVVPASTHNNYQWTVVCALTA